MKKAQIFFIISILTLALTFSGCSQNNNVIRKGTKIKINPEYNFATFVNDKILFYECTGEEYLNYKFYLYNPQDKTTNFIGEIDRVSNHSGDFALLNDEYLYYYPQVADTNKLYKINLIKGEIEVVEERKATTSYIYFVGVSNNEFIIYGVERDVETDIYYNFIDKYNIDGDKVNLLKKSFDMNKTEGDYKISVSIKNDIIYVYNVYMKNGNSKYTIELYNLNGEKFDTYDLPMINELLQGDATFVTHIDVFDDYFYFRTINNKSLLLKYNNGNFKEVKFGEDKDVFYMENKNSNFPYKYFYEFNANKLYVLDINTGSIGEIEIKIERNKFIAFCITDHNGNIVIELFSEKRNPKSSFYFIKAENILKSLNNE